MSLSTCLYQLVSINLSVSICRLAWQARHLVTFWRAAWRGWRRWRRRRWRRGCWRGRCGTWWLCGGLLDAVDAADSALFAWQARHLVTLWRVAWRHWCRWRCGCLAWQARHLAVTLWRAAWRRWRRWLCAVCVAGAALGDSLLRWAVVLLTSCHS